MVLHAIVSDRQGKLLSTLDRDAFRIFENGTPQEIKLFRHEDIPVSLGIVIDGSGSMLQKLPRVEAAALALVHASNPQDEVFVLNFNDQAFLDVPFTNDIQKMEQGLDRIDARGRTAMRDAVKMALDYSKGAAAKEKRVLLVITDGNDNASRTSLDRILRIRDLCNRPVQPGEESRRRPSQTCTQAADLSNGWPCFYPKDVGEVQQLAVEIARDIRSQYLITYSPRVQELDGSYRQIKLAVTAPGNPVARTRNGYYAVPDGSELKQLRGAEGNLIPTPSKENK